MMKSIIVDENEVQRRIYRLALEKRGHDVRAYSNGSDALENYREDPADIMIMDWVLPGIDGLALCRKMKEHDALERRNSFIIMASSRNDIDEMLYALDNGVDDFVSKPVDPVMLEDRIITAEDTLSAANREPVSEYDDPLEVLVDEHMYLRALSHAIEEFFEYQDTDRVNVDALNELCKQLLILELQTHHAKERHFMNHLINVLSRSTNNWFTGISEASLTGVQEQHEYLEKTFSELQGYISIYLAKQKETMELLKRTIAQFDISMSIEENINETELYIKEMGADLDLYFTKKREAVEPILEKLHQYNSMLMKHLDFEEEKFFPFAQRYLDKEDHAELSKMFRGVESLVGRGDIARIKREALRHVHEKIINDG